MGVGTLDEAEAKGPLVISIQNRMQLIPEEISAAIRELSFLSMAAMVEFSDRIATGMTPIHRGTGIRIKHY